MTIVRDDVILRLRRRCDGLQKQRDEAYAEIRLLRAERRSLQAQVRDYRRASTGFRALTEREIFLGSGVEL